MRPVLARRVRPWLVVRLQALDGLLASGFQVPADQLNTRNAYVAWQNVAHQLRNGRGEYDLGARVLGALQRAKVNADGVGRVAAADNQGSEADLLRGEVA